MRAFAFMLLGLTIGGGSDAFGADYYLEGEAVADRGDAVALSRSVSQAGHKSRVERHQLEDGWRFTVRVDGFTDRASADAAAKSIADALGQELAVRQGGEGESAGAVVSAPRGEAPGPLDAGALIARAVKAHKPTSDAVTGATSMLFEFQRRLPDGEIIDHRWASRDDDRYLSLEVIAGDAVSSETRAVGEVGWLTGPGEGTRSDRTHALEAIAHFEPTEIVPFILAFPAIAADRREIQMLVFDGASDLEGTDTLMLRYEGDRATGPIALELDAKTYRVRRVIFEGGKLVHQFDDYRPLTKDLVMPGRVRTWRDGQLADDVELRTLDTDPRLDDAWFEVPGPR